MNLYGILPALITPFDAEGRVYVKSLELLLDRFYSAGADGVYACGQTGEGLLQTVEQRKTVAEVVVANSPKGKQVIMHVGAYRPEEAIELARHASRIGAAAVSSLPPTGPYSFDEVREYYCRLAAASDVPMIVYFFPEVSPVIKSAAQIMELLQLPNVEGLKFTDFNLYDLATIIESTGKIVFNGRDEVLAAGLLMGAVGGIGTFYNLVPGLVVELYEAAGRNEWQRARGLQKKLNDLIRMTARFPMLAAVKQMMSWSGIECGPCLAPRVGLTAAEQEQLREAVAQLGLEEEAFAVTK